jgi:hypothetical protein
MQLDLQKSSGRSSIDPSEAKLGKVDFVRVQSWGVDGEESPKLEDLKIKSFAPAATSVQNNSHGPFYEKLVNRLQLLESKVIPRSYVLRPRNEARNERVIPDHTS